MHISRTPKFCISVGRVSALRKGRWLGGNIWEIVCCLENAIIRADYIVQVDLGRLAVVIVVVGVVLVAYYFEILYHW